MQGSTWTVCLPLLILLIKMYKHLIVISLFRCVYANFTKHKSWWHLFTKSWPGGMGESRMKWFQMGWFSPQFLSTVGKASPRYNDANYSFISRWLGLQWDIVIL